MLLEVHLEANHNTLSLSIFSKVAIMGLLNSTINTVLRAVPVVASILADKLGVTVVFGDFETASTNGKSIKLPFTKLVAVLWGYLVHEAAHIRYTDFIVSRQLGELTFKFLNQVEDIRIENLIVKDFPGTRENLVALNCHLNGLDTSSGVPDPDNPIGVLYAAIYYWGFTKVCRYTGYPLVETLDVFEAVYGKGARIKLGALLGEITSCTSTQEALDLTLLIFQMAKEEFDNKNQNPDGNDCESQDHNQDDNSDAESESGDGYSLPKSCGEESGESGVDENLANSSACSLGQDIDAEVPLVSVFQQLLDSYDAADLPDDRGKAVLASLQCPEHFDVELEEKIVSLQNQLQMKTLDISSEKSTKEDFARARSLSARLAAQLASAIQARSATSRTNARRGSRIDRSKLVPFVTENYQNIFRKNKLPQADVDTAVHILVDMSESMTSGNKMSIASNSAMALAMALKQIRGCNPAVSFYTSDATNPISYGLRHGEDLRSARRFPVEGLDATPTAEALNQAVLELAKVKTNRRILLLLTDGYPDDLSTAKTSARDIERSGEVELIGIGIRSEAIKMFCNKSIVINDPNELLGNLFRIIQTKLAA